jgi:hypothetical protein
VKKYPDDGGSTFLRNALEEGILHSYRHENLKSDVVLFDKLTAIK